MKNELRPYDEYRKIDLPWLSEIPQHWGLTRNKNVLKTRKSLVGSDHGDYKLLSLTLNGIIERDMLNPKGKFPKEFDNYQVVKEEDIVFCLFDVDETPRTVGLSKHEGMITGAYNVYEIDDVNSKFIYYYYLALDNGKLMKPLYTGLRKVISSDTFLRTKCPLPPREEQDQIVKYLDYKLVKINKFIKAKKKLIAVLKEQKQAIINQAVTKGLDANVKMKSSGIEWLGDVPEHWDCTKLKFLTNLPFQYGANETGQTYTENAYRYIRITDITNQGTLKDTGVLYLSDEIGKPYNLSEGDILLARSGATVGKSFLYKSEHGRAAYAGYLIRFKPNRNVVLPDFIYLFTLSGAYSIWLNQIFIQSTIQNVSAEKYKNFVIPVPSIPEQKLIIEYILNETTVFDSTIDRIESEIKLINEYKNSLISSVVTGKVDVRNIVLEEINLENVDELDLDVEEENEDEEDFIDEGGDE